MEQKPLGHESQSEVSTRPMRNAAPAGLAVHVSSRMVAALCRNIHCYALASSAILIFIGYFWGSPEYGYPVRNGLLLLAPAILLGLVGIAVLARSSAPLPFLKQRTNDWLGLLPFLILHGVDPYGTAHTNIYPLASARRYYAPSDFAMNNRIGVGLQYPPLTLLCTIPGYLMGDVRLGFVLAILLSTVCLFAAIPDVRGFVIAALVLFNPVTFVVEMKAWTEPLVWPTLSAVALAAIRRPRYLALAAGLFLASKQYNILALPLLGFLLPVFNWKAYAKLLLSALAVAAVTVLPFAIWNFQALWHDVVTFNFHQPFRADSLSFAVPFPVMLKIGPLLLLAFVLWCIRQAKSCIALFFAAYAFALLLCFSTRNAFLSYYFLIGNLFLLAAVLAFKTLHQVKTGLPVPAVQAQSARC